MVTDVYIFFSGAKAGKSVTIDGAKRVHDQYSTFTGDNASLMNLDWR
jgi:hypothetical protein